MAGLKHLQLEMRPAYCLSLLVQELYARISCKDFKGRKTCDLKYGAKLLRIQAY